MLVALNKGAAAMFVSSTYPLGIKRYSHAKVFFLLWLINMLIDHVGQNII